ncbi:MAG: multidrug effflux MFS transporter [Rhodospirillales bacterium]|nr:multidrug effflux MFS transporter [Rhodospirillales bacterium]
MTSPRSRRVAALLTLLLGITSITIDLTTPALPALTQAFGVPVVEGQWVFSAYLVGVAVTLIVNGPLSDRYGRRPVLLGGLALYVLGGLVCFFGTSLAMVVAGRVIQGVGACTGSVVTRAVVRDVHDEADTARVLAGLITATTIIPIFGNLVGGWLMESFGWRASFAVQAVVGVAAFLAVQGLLAETNTQRDVLAARPGRILAAYGELFRDRTYRGYVTVLFFIYGALFAFVAAGPFYFISAKGYSPTLYGLLYLVVMVGYMAGSFASTKLAARLGAVAILGLGALAALAGAALGLALVMGGNEGLVAVLAPITLVCATVGLVQPAALAGAIGPFPEKAGAASSGAGFMQMSSGVGISYLVGRLHDGTARPMMAVMLVSAFLAALTWALWLRRR